MTATNVIDAAVLRRAHLTATAGAAVVRRSRLTAAVIAAALRRARLRATADAAALRRARLTATADAARPTPGPPDEAAAIIDAVVVRRHLMTVAGFIDTVVVRGAAS